jgi:hypothetical protein
MGAPRRVRITACAGDLLTGPLLDAPINQRVATAEKECYPALPWRISIPERASGSSGWWESDSPRPEERRPRPPRELR